MHLIADSSSLFLLFILSWRVSDFYGAMLKSCFGVRGRKKNCVSLILKKEIVLKPVTPQLPILISLERDNNGFILTWANQMAMVEI